MTSSSSQTQKRICIGKIASAHGVKGLVKISPYCEDVALLNGTLFTHETKNETVDISLRNPSGKHMLAEIKGITNKEDADKIKHKLYIPRDQLPIIDDDDSFYITDLVGLKAFDDSNAQIGHIKAVPNFGAGDLLEVQPIAGQTYLIPFDDAYINAINIEEKTITINADGMAFKDLNA